MIHVIYYCIINDGKWQMAYFIYIYVHNDIDVKLSYQLYDAGKHLPSMYLIWSVSLCILLYVNVLYYGTINDGTCCGTYVYIYIYVYMYYGMLW